MNTEKLTIIARPYALAAFEYALAKADLASWETLLQNAANIVQDKTMVNLLDNPSMTQNELLDIFCSILASELDEQKKNFIHLLAEYDRLNALPEIAELFSTYRSQHEKRTKVHVTSAISLDNSYQQKLAKILAERLKREVELECQVDESLLGGAMLRVDDKVIDGSVRGKLNRLLESL